MNMLKHKFCLLIGLIILLAIPLPVLAEETGGKVQIGSDINIPAEMEVHGDSVAIFANQKIDGRVKATAVTIFGNMEISGKVDGEVVAIFGDIILQEGAEVSGDLVNILGSVKRFGENMVLGEITIVDPGDIGKEIFDDMHLNFLKWRPWINFTFKINNLLISLIVTLIICVFFLSNLKNISTAIQNDPLKIALKGLIGFIAVAFGSILLFVTILGIPAALVLIFVAFLASIVGSAALYLLIGEKLAEQLNWEVAPQWKAVVGALLVGVIVMLPLGVFIKAIIGWLGFGGVIATRFGTRQTWIS